jgi:hypothetical protein
VRIAETRKINQIKEKIYFLIPRKTSTMKLLILFALFAAVSCVSFVDLAKDEWEEFKVSLPENFLCPLKVLIES